MEILKHPSIWPYVSDGYKEGITLPDDWIYITFTGNDIFLLDHEGEFHGGVKPEARKDSYKMCKAALNWLFVYTGLSSIKCTIRDTNRRCLLFVRRCGFKFKYRTKDSQIFTVERFE